MPRSHSSQSVFHAAAGTKNPGMYSSRVQTSTPQTRKKRTSFGNVARKAVATARKIPGKILTKVDNAFKIEDDMRAKSSRRAMKASGFTPQSYAKFQATEAKREADRKAKKRK